jgi:DNA mismatch repair protein MutS2
MISITEKTLQDLQSTVLEPFRPYVIQILETKSRNNPFRDKETLMQALMQTSEYVSSFQNNNAIPNHGFDAISQIKFLAIEDSLEVEVLEKLQPCLQRLIFY